MIDSTHFQVVARLAFRWTRYSPPWCNHDVHRNATRADVADLIDRFLENRLSYPQEWNDFVECSQKDKDVEVYRQKCDKLDPLVNRPDPVDQDAVTELRLLAHQLRASTSTPETSR
jgi:hypothetical protein